MAVIMPIGLMAAPYADFVIDARTGEVLHKTNADTRLHPASLTKMMTLYICFQAIENGEITLDTMVTVSKNAANQAPSRLGLRAGQRIALRYLIRAAAIKSANDAAAAIGDAIEGDKASFARRMNRTAKALGMTRTTFKNANGLTEAGHLSTARDMTTLGRHLFYDFPQYYGIFSRRTADAGIAQVASTNRRFLDAYEGADGIKTGYTGPAGFNLVASAQRGQKRIIATVFGGTSTAMRNQRVAQLLDVGFGKAPNRVQVQKPVAPTYMADATDEETEDLAEAIASNVAGAAPAAAKTIRVAGAVASSPRPRARGAATAPATEAAIAAEDQAIAEEATALAAATDDLMAGMQDTIAAAVAEAQEPVFEQTATPQPETLALMAEAAPAEDAAAPTDEAAAVAPVAVAAAVAEALRPARRPGPAAAAPVAEAPAVEIAATDPAKPETQPAVPVQSAVLQLADIPEPTAASQPAAETLTLAPLPSPANEELDLAEAPKAKPEAPAAKAEPEPAPIVLAAAEPTATVAPPEELETVTRVSTSGGKEWGINVGSFGSSYAAEQKMLKVALVEMGTLGQSLRKVSSRKGAFDANFVGMTEGDAKLACKRLQARGNECALLGPATE